MADHNNQIDAAFAELWPSHKGKEKAKESKEDDTDALNSQIRATHPSILRLLETAAFNNIKLLSRQHLLLLEAVKVQNNNLAAMTEKMGTMTAKIDTLAEKMGVMSMKIDALAEKIRRPEEDILEASGTEPSFHNAYPSSSKVSWEMKDGKQKVD